MPYRVDVTRAGDDALDCLVALGALDVERSPDGGIAALMPDSVAPERVALALGVADLSVSPAVGRDAGSVWTLSPRPTRIGRLRIVPAHAGVEPGALRLTDSAAFGTGLHPTTVMCLEAIEEALEPSPPGALLDVGMLVHRYSGDAARYPTWPSNEPANVFDPVAAAFYFVPGRGSGWRRESYDVRSLPLEPGDLRKLTSTDELQKGH